MEELSEFEEWEDSNLLTDEDENKGFDGKRLRIYFFSFLLVGLFGVLSWLNFSKLESQYLNNMSYVSDGLKDKSQQQVDRLRNDYKKIKHLLEQKLAHAMGEIEELSKKEQKPVKRFLRRKKKVAKIKPVNQKAINLKPMILLTEKEKEAILKEIEILKLESRLDPFAARKDLINLKADLNDKDLVKVINNVLRQI